MRQSRPQWVSDVGGKPRSRRGQALATLVLAGAWLASACGDGTTVPDPIDPIDAMNRPPAATGTIPAQTVQVGNDVTVDLSGYFNDPDGDALTYSAHSSDGGVATVSVSGSNAVVTGARKGDATITVTATDPDGLSAQQSFPVLVPNRPPAALRTISDLDLLAGDTVEIVVAEYFSDPDGDALTYGAATSDAGVATATVDGETVTVAAVADGSASLTVTASDSDGGSAEQSFAANVAPLVDPSIQFVTVSTAAPEGGTVVVEVEAMPVQASALELGYTIGADDDAGTADANEADHTAGTGGMIRFEAGASRATFDIDIRDDDDIEPMRETFVISLNTPGEDSGYVLGSSATAIVTIEEGVCDRLPRVRDELIALTGVEQCHETDASHLAAVATLDLRGPESAASSARMYAQSASAMAERCAAAASSDVPGVGAASAPPPSRCAAQPWQQAPLPAVAQSRGTRAAAAITELRAGDFLGLSGLEQLWLFDNELTALPAGVFSGLRELRHLHLGHNRLSDLPEGLLSDLGRLEGFWLQENELERLPSDLFTGLTRLREVWANENELIELPAGLFSDTDNLEELHLWGNRLATLPTGIFSGLFNLVDLSLYSNRLTELDGAAFSDLTNLENLGFGDNRLTELPHGLFANLGNLNGLWMASNRVEILQRGLFDELTNLRLLVADSNRIADIEDDAFSNLSELEEIWLIDNRLSALRPGMFSGLDDLKMLSLRENRIDDLGSGTFAGLSDLEDLVLSQNPVVELKSDAFAGLLRLERLWVGSSSLSRIHVDAFDGLFGLTGFYLSGGGVSALPDQVFTGLPRLEELGIIGTSIEELSSEMFARLPVLSRLSLVENRLTGLPPDVFATLDRLETLLLWGNTITELPAEVFAGLGALDTLGLSANNLAELPDGLFEGLVELDWLNVEDNPGAPFSLDVQLERRDNASWSAPGPATVVLSLPEGAPFALTVPLSVRRGTLSTDEAVIEQGHTASAEFTVTMSATSQSGTEVVAGPVVALRRGIYGIQVVADDTWVLFGTSGDHADPGPAPATQSGAASEPN